MGRLINMLIMMSAILLVFFFVGLVPADSLSSSLIQIILNPVAFFSSTDITTFLGKLGVTLGATLLGGITAYLTDKSDFIIFGFFLGILIQFGADFLKIYNYVYSVNPIIATLIFSPILFIYAWTIIEWWRGTDINA